MHIKTNIIAISFNYKYIYHQIILKILRCWGMDGPSRTFVGDFGIKLAKLATRISEIRVQVGTHVIL